MLSFRRCKIFINLTVLEWLFHNCSKIEMRFIFLLIYTGVASTATDSTSTDSTGTLEFPDKYVEYSFSVGS